MARRPFVAGNWKMHKTHLDAAAFALEFKRLAVDLGGVDLGIAAAGPLLPVLTEKLKGTHVAVYGQNLHWEASGAFTGETSAAMLTSLGCRGVLIGHSERRQYFGETDEQVANKVAQALANDLAPILCVGETLEERKADQTQAVVERQIRGGVARIEPAMIGQLVLAYEPVWAIGTGETATPQQAQDVHHFIRVLIEEISAPHIAAAIRIQYGGSVKPSNAADLMAMPDIDGALVGGASLSPSDFAAIGQAAQKSL